MKTVVIDRKTWYRGLSQVGSRLLRRDGTKCCVGFAAEQCGVESKQLLDVRTVGGLVDFDIDVPHELQWLAEGSLGAGKPSDSDDVYATNDDPYLTDTAREPLLTYLFAKHDIKLEFIN